MHVMHVYPDRMALGLLRGRGNLTYPIGSSRHLYQVRSGVTLKMWIDRRIGGEIAAWRKNGRHPQWWSELKGALLEALLVRGDVLIGRQLRKLKQTGRSVDRIF